MASKQLLRRLPLLSRERLNQLNLNHGALPDVANDVLPIVTGSSDSTATPRPPHSPSVASNARPVLKPGYSPQSLGRWNQRLSHLQSLTKPMGALALSPSGGDASRPSWPAVAEVGQQSSPTDIAVATLPALAGLLKHKLPVSSVSTIPYAPKFKGTSKDPTDGCAVEQSARFIAMSSTENAPSVTASMSNDDSSVPPPPEARSLPPPFREHQQQLVQSPPPPHVRRTNGNARSSNSANSSIQLNKHIMACKTTEELLALVQHRGVYFDYFNISTALARVPKLALVGSTALSSCNFGSFNKSHQQHGHYNVFCSGHTQAPTLQQAQQQVALTAVMPSFSPAHGSDVHLDTAGRSLLDSLAQLMATHIDSFDARGLANSAWAFGKLKYVPSGGLPAMIAQAALRRMSEFSPQNLSNLVWSFVYMHHADEKLLSAASRFVCARAAEFKPQELANIVWAFASLGHRDQLMLHVAAEQAKHIAPLFKEQELSNVLWALGKMSLRDQPEVLKALMAETRAKLPAFLPQGISNVAWALASVGHLDIDFLDRVVAQCGSQLTSFDVQALANLVWAIASLGYYKPQFLNAVVNECLSRGLDRLSPQNLSNILWGCATLNHRDPRMLSAWAMQTMDKLTSFEPQGVSNTAWSFARLGFHSPQLFQALAVAGLHKMEGFTAQGLSNLAWAMATAGYVQPRLFEALGRQAMALESSFNAQNCSVTLWACATLRHHDEALFHVLLERLLVEVDSCEPQNIANALWAVARMGHPLSRERGTHLVRHASQLLGRMNQQELCNTMWAVACLDLMDEDLFASFCGCLQTLADISPEGMHQAYHAQLMYHSSLARSAGLSLGQLQQLAAANRPASSRLLPCLPEPLHTVALSMWVASAQDVHVSRFHQEVSGALAGAGVPHALEWLTDDQLFSVDIGLQVNGKPVAVEVNGGHHYASNAPHHALGDTAVRRRMLEDRGWSVVDVAFSDWEALGHTTAERGSNLVARIAAALDNWDWRYVGLPLRSASSALAATLPLHPSIPPAPVAVPSDNVSFQQALGATIGLGPLFSSAALTQALPFLSNPFAANVSSGSYASGGIWGDFRFPGLGLNQQQLAAAPATPAVTSIPTSAAVAAGMELDMDASLHHAGSLGMDAQSVQAAVDAAEALSALPGGNRLLAQHMYDVLGVRLPYTSSYNATSSSATVGQAVDSGRSRKRSAADLSEALANLNSLQDEARGGCSLAFRSRSSYGSEDDLVSDDVLERVVQYALA